MKKSIRLSFLMVILILFKAEGNNLTITNISAPTTQTIQFDVSWDNSWYAAAPTFNWDGVWLFVKTQVCGSGSNPWSHANLSNISADHSVAGGVLQVDAVSDGKGVFLRRSALGSGNIATSTVVLRLSAAVAAIASTNYQVVGIEMVNIPQGSFSLGDGSTVNASHSTASYGTSNSPTPYTVASENAIAADALRNDKGGDASITAHPAVIAGFPKGFNSVYCMKYEISQNQYATFLNLLEYSQQLTRTIASPASATGTSVLTATSGDNRNSIEIATPGVAFSTPAVYGNDLNGNNVFDEAGDGGTIACNFLSWDDLKAYLDWSGLRPMTEMEFEKISRGSNTALQTEFPWGSTTINQAISSSLTSGGQVTEVSTSTADGLCAAAGGSSTTLGPLRSGFAATPVTTRTGAAASFFGVMDMGGNVWEQCFQTGFWNGSARAPVANFTGILGDGNLDLSGNANATNWGGVNYSIVRGGNWESINQRVQTSDRFFVNSTAENSTRVRRTGGRGVR